LPTFSLWIRSKIDMQLLNSQIGTKMKRTSHSHSIT
jgi:hypothetical protein